MRRRPPRLAAAMGCLLVLCAAAQARTAHARKADKPASAPTTQQILAPSLATVPDALPPDRRVFRCGSSYSPHPCPEAEADAKPLDIADTRSDAQRRQSEDVTARDKRLASWYEAGRHERDKAASAPSPGRRISAAPATCVDTTTMRCVPKQPRIRKVSMPGRASAALARSR